MSVRGGKRAGVNFDFIMGANRVVQSTGQASNFGIAPVSPLVNGGKTVLRLL